jgi:hypothetical protein
LAISYLYLHKELRSKGWNLQLKTKFDCTIYKENGMRGQGILKTPGCGEYQFWPLVVKIECWYYILYNHPEDCALESFSSFSKKDIQIWAAKRPFWGEIVMFANFKHMVMWNNVGYILKKQKHFEILKTSSFKSV